MPLSTGNSLFWSAGLDVRGLKTGVARAKGILASLTKNISAMDVFAGLALGAGVAFAKISKTAHEFSRNFQSAMLEVSTISDSVRDDFKGMSAAIMEMSTSVPEGAVELTEALYQIVSAGNDGAEAFDMLRVSAELAIATVTDTKTAADAMTSIMNAFRESAGSADNVASKLFTTIKNAKTTMAELGPAITKITGLWANMGGTFEDLMAMISTGAKTLKTDIMMTGIRGIATALIKPAEEAKEAARELGIEFTTSALRAKGFLGFMKEIITATKMVPEELAKFFPDVRGLTGLLAVLTDEGKEFERQVKNINESISEHTTAFRIMVESDESQAGILKNNIIAKLKPLGDAIVGITTDMSRGMNEAFARTRNEFTNVAQDLDRYLTLLQSRRGEMDKQIKIMEELATKTDKTTEETIELTKAESSLAIYMPEVFRAMEEGATSVDILRIAKERLTEADKKMLELQLKIARIQVRAAGYNIEEYKLGEDASADAIRRIRAKIESNRKLITDEHEYAVLLGDTSKTLQDRLGQDRNLIRLEGELALATGKNAVQGDLYNIELERRIELVRQLEEAVRTGKMPEPPASRTTPPTSKGTGEGDLFDPLAGQYAGIRPGAGLGARGDFDFKGAENWYTGLVSAYKRVGVARKELSDLEKEADKDRLESMQEFREELFQVSIAIEEVATLFAMAFGEEQAQNIYAIADAVHKVIGVLDDLGLEKLSDFDWSKLKVGDWLTLLNSTFSVIGSIFGIFKKTETLVESLAEAFEKFSRSLESVYGEEKLARLIEARLAIWKTIQDMREADYRNRFVAIHGQEEYTRALTEAYEIWRDIDAQVKEMTLGIASPKTIADNIAEGFRQGKRSIEDFNETFEQMMQDAIVKAFANAIVKPAVADFYDTFAKAAEEGGISEQELADLQSMWKALIGGVGEQWKDFEDLFGDVSGLQRPSLKGAIKGMTEQTAGILAGQFNAIRMNTVQGLQLMEAQVVYLSQISHNTSYNRLLVSIDRKLDARPGNYYLRSQGA